MAHSAVIVNGVTKAMFNALYENPVLVGGIIRMTTTVPYTTYRWAPWTLGMCCYERISLHTFDPSTKARHNITVSVPSVWMGTSTYGFFSGFAAIRYRDRIHGAADAIKFDSDDGRWHDAHTNTHREIVISASRPDNTAIADTLRKHGYATVHEATIGMGMLDITWKRM